MNSNCFFILSNFENKHKCERCLKDSLWQLTLTTTSPLPSTTIFHLFFYFRNPLWLLWSKWVANKMRKNMSEGGWWLLVWLEREEFKNIKQNTIFFNELVIETILLVFFLCRILFFKKTILWWEFRILPCWNLKHL